VALGAKLKPDYLSTWPRWRPRYFFSSRASPSFSSHVSREGPDLRADWQGTPHFVEVKTVVHSEEDSRFKGLSNEIMRKLNSIPSSYSVAITVGDMYLPRTQPFKWAIEAIVKSLEILKEEKWKGATLYYSEGESCSTRTATSAVERISWQHPSEAPGHCRQCGLHRKVPERGRGEVEHILLDSREQRAVPQADKSHERLKGILDKKRKQLPRTRGHHRD